MYLLFLYLGTIWLSSCHRYTEAGHQERGGSSYHREETSCNRERQLNLNLPSKLFLCLVVCAPPSPGGVAHAQRFPLVILSRVWDLLISRLRAFLSGRFPRPPPPLSVRRPVFSVSSAPERHVHQALAAGSQLGVRAPAGRGGTGFGLEAEEMEEEGDGHLGISRSVSHLE